jgi:hypothetical protein
MRCIIECQQYSFIRGCSYFFLQTEDGIRAEARQSSAEQLGVLEATWFFGLKKHLSKLSTMLGMVGN